MMEVKDAKILGGLKVRLMDEILHQHLEIELRTD